MAQQIIDVGSVANDHTGDPFRTAFTKVNSNFTELYDEASTVPVTIVPTSGATQALAFPSSGSCAYDITLTADCAFTLSGGTSGRLQQITILLRQDATAGHTPFPPAGIKWRSGAPPTPNTASGRFDLWTLATLDGGTTVLGSY